MGLFDLESKNLTVPLYDLGTLAAGFYIGCAEGKGIEKSPSLRYLTKYGPSVLAVISTSVLIKLGSTFGKRMNQSVTQNFQNGNLEVILQDGSKKMYQGLTREESEEITPKLVKGINQLESSLQNPRYLKPILKMVARTAIETSVAYLVGRAYSKIIK